VFTPFHKPPYPYLYGRSIDETTTPVDIEAWEGKSVREFVYLAYGCRGYNPGYTKVPLYV
jgi:hypothetical protein